MNFKGFNRYLIVPHSVTRGGKYTWQAKLVRAYDDDPQQNVLGCFTATDVGKASAEQRAKQATENNVRF